MKTINTHAWTVTQVRHLRATLWMTDHAAARSLRHRFGARVSAISDRAIRHRRYHLRNGRGLSVLLAA